MIRWDVTSKIDFFEFFFVPVLFFRSIRLCWFRKVSPRPSGLYRQKETIVEIPRKVSPIPSRPSPSAKEAEAEGEGKLEGEGKGAGPFVRRLGLGRRVRWSLCGNFSPSDPLLGLLGVVVT